MTSRLGAYGLELGGVSGADRWLVPQAAGAPKLDLACVQSPLPRREPVLDGDRADLGLLEGVWLQAEAASTTVTFTSPRELDVAELIHPLLAPAAALQWLWRGRECLHAGAALLGEVAVLLLGDKESGKSTTLAALADVGHPVMADDLVVVTPQLTMPAGPRSIDRRPGPPGHGEPVRGEPVRGAWRDAPVGEAVRGGERERIALPPVPAGAEAPIRGWVALAWGRTCALEPLTATERMATLAAARRVRRLPGNPETLLELAALPAYRLIRPRQLAQVAPATAVLTRAFS